MEVNTITVITTTTIDRHEYMNCSGRRANMLNFNKDGFLRYAGPISHFILHHIAVVVIGLISAFLSNITFRLLLLITLVLFVSFSLILALTLR